MCSAALFKHTGINLLLNFFNYEVSKLESKPGPKAHAHSQQPGSRGVTGHQGPLGAHGPAIPPTWPSVQTLPGGRGPPVAP